MSDWLQSTLRKSLANRASLARALGPNGAFRALADRGVVVDVYGPGAALLAYEGQLPSDFDGLEAARVVLETLRSLGVTAVYFKPFPRDRSRMGGEMPAIVTDRQPAAGDALPEAVLVDEYGAKLEIRLFDGFSTGLFLDQRENRRFIRKAAESFAGGDACQLLNTFAYTCAFSVAGALGGAKTTSVDVSPRYLDWGRRNFAHNDLPTESGDHRFARMDTFEFFNYARRKALTYDIIILDPPSFASGNKKKGIRPWSCVTDYARLVSEARALLRPNGLIFASTNTQELCHGDRLDREILKALGRKPRWLDLPNPPQDFDTSAGKFTARAFVPA